MNTAIRGGHNFSVPGASGLIDETTEDRKVYAAVIKYLKQAGESVYDVTSSIPNINEELAEGVIKANNLGVDLFASIHFNKCYDSYNGALGSEIWLNPNNSNATCIAKRILSNLEALGFENRGIKDGINGEHLYEVKHTNMAGMIIEVCFVEASKDVNVYKKNGPDKIGLAIAEGILGKKIKYIESSEEEEEMLENIVCYNNQVDKRAAEYLADYLKCPTIDNKAVPFDYSKMKNVYAVGAGEFSRYTKKIIGQGKDRWGVITDVLKFCGKL